MYNCDICPKAFQNVKGLNAHKLVHVGGHHYSCDACNKTFSRSSEFKTHKKIYHNTVDKPFSCDICDITCTTSYELNTHRRIHTGEKPFSCSSCDKFFTRKSQLTEHLKTRIHAKRVEANKTKARHIANDGEDNFKYKESTDIETPDEAAIHIKQEPLTEVYIFEFVDEPS